MEVSLNAHKQKVADLETAARECSITHHHALQVCTLPCHDCVHCVLQMHWAPVHIPEYITPFSSIYGLPFLALAMRLSLILWSTPGGMGAWQCTVSSCTLTGCVALHQVQTQAAQNEVAAAQLARHETANIQRKLKAASERNAAQQSKLAQLQAEVERLQAEVQQLQQQLQGVQVVTMFSASMSQVFVPATAGSLCVSSVVGYWANWSYKCGLGL